MLKLISGYYKYRFSNEANPCITRFSFTPQVMFVRSLVDRYVLDPPASQGYPLTERIHIGSGGAYVGTGSRHLYSAWAVSVVALSFQTSKGAREPESFFLRYYPFFFQVSFSPHGLAGESEIRRAASCCGVSSSSSSLSPTRMS